MSLGWHRGLATGVRKFVLAGLAADVPAAALLITASLASGQSWLPVVLGGGFAVVILVGPSAGCFHAAYALSRGDPACALRGAGLTASAIGIPAAIATGLAVPIAITGLQPCELCLQAGIALVVLGGYAIPALIAALLVASARRWIVTRGTRFALTYRSPG